MPSDIPLESSEFLKERMTRIGWTEERNKVPSVDTESPTTTEYEDHKNVKTDVLIAHKRGIRINYLDLRGRPYRLEDGGYFYRIRLLHPKDDMKYYQPPKSPVLPFFTPEVIEKYLRFEEIDTLYFTEGEIKSLAVSRYLPIIGFPSIHGPYDKQSPNFSLHHDIVKVIKRCKVKKVCFITDADTLKVNYQPDKDLSYRLTSFFSAIQSYYDACYSVTKPRDHESELLSIHWGHILRRYDHKGAKGIDDLLEKLPARRDDIIGELTNLTNDGSYKDFFSIYEVNTSSLKTLKKEVFCLNDEKDFFRNFRDDIPDQEDGNKAPFLYKRRFYQYREGKLIHIRHQDADLYIRVGTDYFKRTFRLLSDGSVEEELQPWKRSTIKEDYKKFPAFLDDIQKFDNFTLDPSMNGTYRRVITVGKDGRESRLFNLFNPCQYELQPGSIDTSLQFLKHLFERSEHERWQKWTSCTHIKEKVEAPDYDILRQAEGDPFTLALDYLTLLIQNPRQRLPVMCLVSEEENTGKTTFLKWLQLIFTGNAVILDNERFTMNFNAHFATKYIIGLDESFMDVEKKSEKERLKQLVTAPSIFMEQKGANIKEIPFYGKLIFCSNNADNIMHMTENDSRWFVVKVVPYKTEDPDMLDKLKEEIPAFVHYLMNRNPFHQRASRLYFTKEQIATDQLKEIIKNTKPPLDRAIDLFIEETFETFNLDTLEISLKLLHQYINEDSKFRANKTDIKKSLNRRGVHASPKAKRFRFPISYADNMPDDPEDHTEYINWWNEIGKAYTFHKKDWVKEKVTS